MNKALPEKDYARVEKSLRDIQSSSGICSENIYRLANGFATMTDISEHISELYLSCLENEASAAILNIIAEADNNGCFDTAQFTLYADEEEGIDLDTVFCKFIQNTQKLSKDLEHLREMVNTGLQFIDTTLSMTKEIEATAKTERKHLKEKDKK